jgi:hypothetical protein
MYDFRRMHRRSYYPHNQQIVSTVTATSSSGMVASRPVTPAVLEGNEMGRMTSGEYAKSEDAGTTNGMGISMAGNGTGNGEVVSGDALEMSEKTRVAQ